MNLQVEGTKKILLVESDQGLTLNTETNPVLVTLIGSGSPNSGSSDAKYVYTQSSASAIWVVPHNLNKYCSVTVVDSNNDVVIGDIRYNSLNQVTLTFTAAFTGQAYCN